MAYLKASVSWRSESLVLISTSGVLLDTIDTFWGNCRHQHRRNGQNKTWRVGRQVIRAPAGHQCHTLGSRRQPTSFGLCCEANTQAREARKRPLEELLLSSLEGGTHAAGKGTLHIAVGNTAATVATPSLVRALERGATAQCSPTRAARQTTVNQE